MKRILSILLALSMIFSIAVLPVSAEEQGASPALEVMHNIAAKYAGESIVSDGNMLWLVPDMATYSELFPESEYQLSPELKQPVVDKIITVTKNSNAPAALAKAIIALRSLGYDSSQVYTKDLEQLDFVSRLTALVDSGASSVTSVYTLPYVLIALQQGTDYATSEQITYLIEALVSAKASWQDTTWGPDTATPAILALAPYYKTNDAVKAAIDEALPIITGLQQDSGVISNAASTGLAMAAFSAIGIDAEELIKGENTLIDGLLSQSTDTNDGFKPTTNSFSTEQGFRGLLGWQLLKTGISKRVYDFASYPMEPAYETRNTHCIVSFELSPADAEVTIEDFTPAEDGTFKLPAGEYSYTIKKSGYYTSTGSVTITDEDVNNAAVKNISVTLERRSSGGGTIGTSQLCIKVNIMVHGDDCENSLTYKNNSSEFTSLTSKTVLLDKGDSVYDALCSALDSANIDFAEDNGYVSSIGDYAEFAHGDNSGWMFIVDGEHSDLGCRETKLTKSSTIVWYYTDNYTLERGSEDYNDNEDVISGTLLGFGLSGRNKDITNKPVTNPGKTFADIADHKNRTQIEALAQRGFINGKTEDSYDPDNTMTRAEFATIVVGALGLPETGTTNFKDVTSSDWFYTYINTAYHYGIVSGISADSFNPSGTITRQEAAAMVTRAAKLAGMDTDINILSAKNILAEFTDYISVSSWAFTSLGFCYAEGILDRSAIEILPEKAVTRAEIAEMLYNMLGKAKLI